MEDRGHVLARGGFPAAGVGEGHRDAGGVEVFVGDRAWWRAGDRGDLRQDVPLRRSESVIKVARTLTAAGW